MNLKPLPATAADEQAPPAAAAGAEGAEGTDERFEAVADSSNDGSQGCKKWSNEMEAADAEGTGEPAAAAGGDSDDSGSTDWHCIEDAFARLLYDIVPDAAATDPTAVGPRPAAAASSEAGPEHAKAASPAASAKDRPRRPRSHGRGSQAERQPTCHTPWGATPAWGQLTEEAQAARPVVPLGLPPQGPPAAAAAAAAASEPGPAAGPLMPHPRFSMNDMLEPSFQITAHWQQHNQALKWGRERCQRAHQTELPLGETFTVCPVQHGAATSFGFIESDGYQCQYHWPELVANLTAGDIVWLLRGKQDPTLMALRIRGAPLLEQMRCS